MSQVNRGAAGNSHVANSGGCPITLPAQVHNIKPGDKVRCIAPKLFNGPKLGDILVVDSYYSSSVLDSKSLNLTASDGTKYHGGWTQDKFELVSSSGPDTSRFKIERSNLPLVEPIEKADLKPDPYEEYNSKYNLEEP